MELPKSRKYKKAFDTVLLTLSLSGFLSSLVHFLSLFTFHAAGWKSRLRKKEEHFADKNQTPHRAKTIQSGPEIKRSQKIK